MFDDINTNWMEIMTEVRGLAAFWSADHPLL